MFVIGRGDDTAGNPRRAQISRFELFEFCYIVGIIQTNIYRAIRANSISINGIFPPSSSGPSRMLYYMMSHHIITYVHMYICICICVCIDVCIYIYIYMYLYDP